MTTQLQVLIIILVAAVCAAGQSPKDKSIEDKFRSDEIERVRRMVARRAEYHETVFPQIKQDFERIQIINNELVEATSRKRTIDRAEVSAKTAEIHKRAVRLRSQLFESSPKKPTVLPDSDQRDVRKLLLRLDQSVARFVHNAMFENTRVINADDLTAAQRELDTIIRLTNFLKRTH